MQCCAKRTLTHSREVVLEDIHIIFLIRESQSGQADTGKTGPGKSSMKEVQTDEQIGGSNDNSQKREQFGVHMHLVFILPGAKVMYAI